MSDQYAGLRDALSNVEFHDDGPTKRQIYDPKEWEIAANPEILRALLAERDAQAAEIDALIARVSEINHQLSEACREADVLRMRVRRSTGQICHNAPSPISQEFLSLFYYKDGRIHRKSDDSLADTYVLNGGYRWVRLQKNGFRESHTAHRLAWTLVHGSIPDGMEIDHVDRNRVNNALSNLRLVTKRQNQYNKPVKGAVYRKDIGKWQAQIRTPSGRKHLGVFDTQEGASAAYQAAKKSLIEEHGAALSQGEQR